MKTKFSMHFSKWPTSRAPFVVSSTTLVLRAFCGLGARNLYHSGCTLAQPNLFRKMTTDTASGAGSSASAYVIPEGFSLHTENSARILLPASADAFLNPVQEFNRDLSVACIRVWSEDVNKIKKEKWSLKREKRLGRVQQKAGEEPDKKRVKSEFGARELVADGTYPTSKTVQAEDTEVAAASTDVQSPSVNANEQVNDHVIRCDLALSHR
jgi:hypothetical protein